MKFPPHFDPMRLESDFIYNDHETFVVQVLEAQGLDFECWTGGNDVCKYLHHPDSGHCFHIPNSPIYDESEELFNTFSLAWDKWSTGRGMYVFQGIRPLVTLLKFAPHIDTDTEDDMNNWEQALRPFIQSYDYQQ